jgi:hypothetical protein
MIFPDEPEFALFKKTGKITENLEFTYEALCSIKPTSLDNERTFRLLLIYAAEFFSLCDESLLLCMMFFSDV